MAISARCYHARARGRSKAGCGFTCEDDADGLTVETLDGDSFVTIDGPVVLSHRFICLLNELAELRDAGVAYFRLSPHTTDMVAVAELHRNVLDEVEEPGSAFEKLQRLESRAPFSNGFYYGRAGEAWIGKAP